MILPPESMPPVSGLVTPLTQLFISWKTNGRRDDERRTDPIIEQARRTVWILRRAYEEATDNDFAEAALREFRLLIPSGVRAARFFVVWMDLVETLCQEAEKTYGTKKDQGEYKAQQVKAALVHLILEEEHFDIPRVPSFLKPVVVELFVNISIDTIVMLLNGNKLWVPAPPGPVPQRNLLAAIVWALMKFGKWLMRLALVVRFGQWLKKMSMKAVLRGNPISPAVRRQLDLIKQADGPTIQDVLKRIEHLIGWMQKYRKNIVALIELVSAAAREAENFIHLSGSEKKEFARELVIAFLEDYDVIRTQFAYIITEWVLDWAIDAVVRLFNKNGAFSTSHRTAA
jgi:hypothetical protein